MSYKKSLTKRIMTISILGLMSSGAYAAPANLCINNTSANTLIFSAIGTRADIELAPAKGVCFTVEDKAGTVITVKNDTKEKIGDIVLGANIEKTTYSEDKSVDLFYDAFIRAGNGYIDVSIMDRTTQLSMTKWMSQLKDSTLISNITLPGSHDAGMSEAHNCSLIVKRSWTITQSDNIGDQLRSGSRIFDVQIETNKSNKLVTFHKSSVIGCQGEAVENILKDTFQFVSSYNKEFVVLRVSHTDKHSMEAFLKLLNSKYKSKLAKVTNPIWGGLKVGDVRGKVLVIVEPDYAKLVSDYKLDQYITLGKKITDPTTYDPKDDVYGNLFGGYANTQNFDDMFNKQVENMSYNRPKNLGFQVSWTFTGSFFGRKDIEYIANSVNASFGYYYPQLLASVENIPQVVNLDFISPALVYSIVKRQLP
ncbi:MULTISPECIES: phosphatidylinositol-specific phospholipase C domain-containing protein [Cysteiniphilum]|uniref:1-phosphatidylinositol phosphodiesterase n=1 Tax=Cysteiniphilum litorale TaxID=2056700 RepID=A0A8J2Z2H2_9GAMM|nr:MULTISPECIES: phosphatidylinositol-specific phospholipase C domain-containing protein [Cysteiniphilum]GGF88896.1 hypothetical protein GCM10010995_02690 [Cysteiniphilum litorale]